MLIHPDVHLEIGRQRHQALRADARSAGIARGRDDLTGRSSPRTKLEEGAKAGFARVDALLQRLTGRIEPGDAEGDRSGGPRLGDGDTMSTATEVLRNG